MSEPRKGYPLGVLSNTLIHACSHAPCEAVVLTDRITCPFCGEELRDRQCVVVDAAAVAVAQRAERE